MRLSTKGRYATRIMLCIARLQNNGAVPKKIISEEEGISTDYIEQIVVPLKNAGLVSSTRGLHGGFRLTKAPIHITLYDILSATEGEFKQVDKLMEGKSRSDSTVMEDVWQGAFQELYKYFSTISLQDCLENYVKLMDKEPIMFNI
ncbi:MAG: RrF2 family transcriptional regulator [Pontiellaceae bacterium]